ncbi:penicillin-binding protein 2 [Salinisphaera sp.]|uniref:penicillin-binding protein 2 n=1 Tax=Salinisphaera sp. TaxID=1914330 RepID=UPI002D78E7F5|nr:penicillin-binding protein 2 [Salinisphaera sp.]HET7312869.1 penicillin-binding protein 2 [Salinisphaera sp.]
MNESLKNHARERRLFRRRLLVAAAGAALLFLALGARLVDLQVLDYHRYRVAARDNRTRIQAIPPVRGLIYDRDHTVLADNRTAYALNVVPNRVSDMDAMLDRLADIVPISKAERRRFLDRVDSGPGYRAVPLVAGIDKRTLARFEVNRSRFPGVEVHAGLMRQYPLGKAAAHVIGYVSAITASDLRRVDASRYQGTANIGKSGVEYSYESQLHGYPGSRVVEVNAIGRPLRELERHAPQAGDTLYLTLDAELQKTAFHALGDKAGAVVALDPQTGGVLAMVSKPSFDPELFVNGISVDAYHRLLSNDRNPLFNRAIQGEYPPGSTVKPVMALAGMEAGNIDPYERVWCPGYITLPGSSHRYRGWKRSGQGWLNLIQAITRSADVYFYKLGLQTGIDDLYRYATMFGLGQKTGIDLARENSGLMPSPTWKHGVKHRPWYPGETLNTVIGQGYVTATPLQLAQMTSLIAERGHGFKPHLLKAWRSAGSNELHEYKPVALPPIRLKDARHWDIVIQGMRNVVSAPHGTAYWYVGQNLDYPIAGKSGTAQVASLPQHQAAPDEMSVPRPVRPHALFIAFAPIEDPRIAVAVVVDHGGGGSSIAGPIARRVIDQYLDNTPPADKTSSTIQT